MISSFLGISVTLVKDFPRHSGSGSGRMVIKDEDR